MDGKSTELSLLELNDTLLSADDIAQAWNHEPAPVAPKVSVLLLVHQRLGPVISGHRARIAELEHQLALTEVERQEAIEDRRRAEAKLRAWEANTGEDQPRIAGAMMEGSNPFRSLEHFTHPDSPCRLATKEERAAVRETLHRASFLMCANCRLVLKDRNGSRRGTIHPFYMEPIFMDGEHSTIPAMPSNAAAKCATCEGTGAVDIGGGEMCDDCEGSGNAMDYRPHVILSLLARMTPEELSTFSKRFNAAKLVGPGLPPAPSGSATIRMSEPLEVFSIVIPKERIGPSEPMRLRFSKTCELPPDAPKVVFSPALATFIDECKSFEEGQGDK